MRVFIVGISGQIGGLLAARLHDQGADVSGLVRSESQQASLAARGVRTGVGAIGELSAEALARTMGSVDALVYAAGSNGGPRHATDAVDGRGVRTALRATAATRSSRFVLVSVFPESWRERNLTAEEEHYFAVKKRADVAVTRSGLNWVILRPSLLVDEPASGQVSLGPAEIHDQIPRADVAEVLVELLRHPGINQQILELNRGDVPISEAVSAVTPEPLNDVDPLR